MSNDKQNQIKKLYQEGYTTSDIYEYLKQEGVSFIEVMNFIRSNKAIWAEENPTKDTCYICECSIDIKEPKQEANRLDEQYVRYSNTAFYIEEMNICHECVVQYVKRSHKQDFIKWAEDKHKLL